MQFEGVGTAFGLTDEKVQPLEDRVIAEADQIVGDLARVTDHGTIDQLARWLGTENPPWIGTSCSV